MQSGLPMVLTASPGSIKDSLLRGWSGLVDGAAWSHHICRLLNVACALRWCCLHSSRLNKDGFLRVQSGFFDGAAWV